MGSIIKFYLICILFVSLLFGFVVALCFSDFECGGAIEQPRLI